IAVSRPDVDAIATNGAVAQAVLLTGDVVRSEVLGSRTLPISDEAIEAARGRQWLFETVEVPGATLRLYNMPLLLEGQPIGILQVARPIRETEAVLAIVRLVLASGASFSIVVSILLSLLVARTALRPIDLLTRDAERIGKAQDFGARVSPRSATRTDEVGRLAATFNGMLDRLQEAFGALTRANEKLEAGLTSQRRFVADASHELRTPLTTVRGNASLLRRFERLTPEDRAAAVEQIAAESERMSRLVNDLLTLARADAGQRLECESVALGPLIDDVALQGRVLAESKVAISVVRLTDAHVRGDADALRQLLLILVDNAVKYTPRGGSVTIGLSTDSQGASREQGATARISVVDTGVGIPAADLPHVFERFYRADRARQAGGTGLGLSIGKWIAEAHGGTISVDSAPGTGSIFTITLPAIVVTPLPPATVVRRQDSPAPVDPATTAAPVPSPTP
ncbi:MAG: cell wall metabolism sensor histidine kinase WalK, partial [Chloroflexota bacterium]|nr:cell wall metabolism sensor histidine kinase WalK [Chloroflexota bacterium]